MDVFAAVFACSLHGDGELVRAIVDNAHDDPLFVLDPDAPPEEVEAPRTRAEGVVLLRSALAAGRRPLVGLLQVPAPWAFDFGRSPEELFNPCINVAIGSAMLSAYDYACARAGGRPGKGLPLRRECVLRRYAEALGLADLPMVVSLNLRSVAVDASPADAPILPPTGGFQAWGPRCLFVTAPARIGP